MRMLVPRATGFITSAVVKTLLRSAAFALLTTASCAPFNADKTRYQADALPRIGLAVKESSGRWCAQFAADGHAAPVEVAQPGALIFAKDRTPPSLPVVIGGPRRGSCETAFAQPRWLSSDAFALDPAGAPPPPAGAIVALIVMSKTPWQASPHAVATADLDGDGALEEVHRCLADEGEHWTVWTLHNDGARVRRWHEYFDWGAIVDADCGPGDDGVDE